MVSVPMSSSWQTVYSNIDTRNKYLLYFQCTIINSVGFVNDSRNFHQKTVKFRDVFGTTTLRNYHNRYLLLNA